MKIEIKLRGPCGEPINLRRSFSSHGIAHLPPFFINEDLPSLTVTLAFTRFARTVTVAPGRKGHVIFQVEGSVPTAGMEALIVREVCHVLRLDEDLSEFYAMVQKDKALSWAASGSGRLIRSQTVFEEIVKTICTTNCAWSATERMVGALVEYLGKSAPGAPKSSAIGRAFPTPQAMANASDDFYRDVVRAGYRSVYLKSLACRVAEGDVDLAELDSKSPVALSDDEVERRLLELPGIGPYAAAHIMMMLGRYSRLILDSWTRPKYARLMGKGKISDEDIQRRFSVYGKYAGLAFWLFLTRDWVDEK